MRKIAEIRTEMTRAEESGQAIQQIRCIHELEKAADDISAWWDQLMLERQQEIYEAEVDGRLAVLPSKSEETIRIVETALQLKLYDWQKAYITGASDYIMPGRVSGKTTAYMVKLCLSEGPKIDIWAEADRYLDEYHGVHYTRCFIADLREIYHELRRVGGLKLREISFVRRRSQEEYDAVAHAARPFDGIDYGVDTKEEPK